MDGKGEALAESLFAGVGAACGVAICEMTKGDTITETDLYQPIRDYLVALDANPPKPKGASELNQWPRAAEHYRRLVERSAPQ